MVFKKNIHIPVMKWRDLVNNSDLRFFEHKKHLLLTTSREFEGYVIKINTWDDTSLRNDYEILKKIKHQNVITPLCYFEYEGDILQYLSNDEYDICTDKGDFEDTSVIIRKYYPALNQYDMYLDDKIYKQIVLCMFNLLIVHKIRMNNLDISNILFENCFLRRSPIKYNIFSKEYVVYNKVIVKIDLENIEILESIDSNHIQELTFQITHILHNLKCRKNIDISFDTEPINIMETILEKI